MKIYTIIILLSFLFIIGCTSSNMALRDNQIDGMRPLMERTPDEDKINIAIPVYKF
jgi:uncharacterized membrane protein